MSSTPRRRLLLVPLLFLISACSRNPKDLRVWRPSDHDRTDQNAQAAQAAQESSSQPSGDLAAPAKMLGVDQVVLVTWRQDCTRCHGMLGRGDGPQGAMFGARDLSDPAWQASASDAEITTAITKGKGKMPAFDLPASTVKGLVHLVRMMNANRGAPQASASANAPADSATAGAATRPAKASRRAAAPKGHKSGNKPQ